MPLDSVEASVGTKGEHLLSPPDTRFAGFTFVNVEHEPTMRSTSSALSTSTSTAAISAHPNVVAVSSNQQPAYFSLPPLKPHIIAAANAANAANASANANANANVSVNGVNAATAATAASSNVKPSATVNPPAKK